MKLFKKTCFVILAFSLVGLFGYGCDTGVGGVCTENGGMVANTMGTELKFPCNISSPTGATTLTSGYTGTLTSVRWLANALAQDGFVVLSFTPTNIMGMVDGWRRAHISCFEKLQSINSSHSKLRGMISDYSTCGHSKGGGGSLWASSQLGSKLTTTVGMAPWMEGFTAATLRSITAATFIQAGGGDTLAVAAMTASEYSGLGSIDKCYKTYAGYSHMAWASASGSRASTLAGDISAWMNYYMKGVGSPPSGCTNNPVDPGCN